MPRVTEAPSTPPNSDFVTRSLLLIIPLRLCLCILGDAHTEGKSRVNQLVSDPVSVGV